MANVPATWRDALTVNTTTAGAQFDPDIIQLANGNIVVSWTTNDAGGLGSPNGTETFAQIFSPRGEKIGNEIRLNNVSTTDDEQNADLVALPNGGFIVVYHDLVNPASTPAGASNIRLEEYDANGAQVAESSLVLQDNGSGNDPNYRNPVVAVSSATSVLVVYEEVNAGVPAVVGKLYNPTTDTYGAQFNLITGGGVISDTTDVTALTNGNYVIATAQNIGGDNAIVYRIVNSTGGNVLGASFVTGTNTNTQSDVDPSVTALTGGGFVIAYTNNDGTDTDVNVRVYNAAGTQTGSSTVGLGTNNDNEPKVVALADGSFVVVTDNDEADTQQATHFSATGTNLGTFQFGGPGNEASAVGLADGRFAVVWSDFTTGELSLEILDTRDAIGPAMYTPLTQFGTVGDDVRVMTSGVIFDGGAGNDIVLGTGGIDNMAGGDGADYLYGGGGADIIDGGAGSDTLSFVGATTGMTLQMGSLGPTTGQVFAGEPIGMDVFSNIEHILCGDQGDTVGGDAQGNFVAGFGGNDVIFGGGGNDTLWGGEGNDQLFGQFDHDILVGENGNDQLFGWAGNDTLTGGAGADSFMWTGAGEGLDTVIDYSYAEGDLIDVVGDPNTFIFYQAGTSVLIIDPGTGLAIFDLQNYNLSNGLAIV
jgi:hypothetical protein